MVTKNDSFKCDNCRPIFNGECICDITQESIPNQGCIEGECCTNFKSGKELNCKKQIIIYNFCRN